MGLRRRFRAARRVYCDLWDDAIMEVVYERCKPVSDKGVVMRILFISYISLPPSLSEGGLSTPTQEPTLAREGRSKSQIPPGK